MAPKKDLENGGTGEAGGENKRLLDSDSDVDDVRSYSSSAASTPEVIAFPADVKKSWSCTDLLWVILFVVQLGVGIMTVGKCLHPTLDALDALKTERFPSNRGEAIAELLLVATAYGVITTSLWVTLQRSHARAALSMEVVLSLVTLTVLCVIAFNHNLTHEGWALAVAIFVTLIYMWSHWMAIRFTVELGDAVNKVTFKFCPGAPFGEKLVVFVFGGMTILCAMLVAATLFLRSRTPVSFVGSVPVKEYIQLAFCFYWTIGVLRNFNYTITCGALARSYYGDRKRATMRSLGLALTSGLGPICFAALIRWPVEVIRFLGRVMACTTSNDKGDAKASSLLITCVGGCMAWGRPDFLQLLTSAALCHVALHGTDLCVAARSLATVRSLSGMQDIADRDFTPSLSGPLVSIFCAGIAATAMYFTCALPYFSGLITAADTDHQEIIDKVYGEEALGLASLPGVLGKPWSCRIFVSVAAGLAAASLVPLGCGLEASTNALVACWGEEPALLEKREPKLHSHLRQYVIAASGGHFNIAGTTHEQSQNDHHSKDWVQVSGLPSRPSESS